MTSCPKLGGLYFVRNQAIDTSTVFGAILVGGKDGKIYSKCMWFWPTLNLCSTAKKRQISTVIDLLKIFKLRLFSWNIKNKTPGYNDYKRILRFIQTLLKPSRQIVASSRLPDSRENENNCVGKASGGLGQGEAGPASPQAPLIFRTHFFLSFLSPGAWTG